MRAFAEVWTNKQIVQRLVAQSPSDHSIVLMDNNHQLKNRIVHKGVEMELRTNDVVPICEAQAGLTEIAEEVVDGGAKKVLTKNGASCVAIVDAKKLDHHIFEEKYAGLVLLDEAETGLRQIMAGQRISAADLMKALSE